MVTKGTSFPLWLAIIVNFSVWISSHNLREKRDRSIDLNSKQPLSRKSTFELARSNEYERYMNSNHAALSIRLQAVD